MDLWRHRLLRIYIKAHQEINSRSAVLPSDQLNKKMPVRNRHFETQILLLLRNKETYIISITQFKLNGNIFPMTDFVEFSRL